MKVKKIKVILTSVGSQVAPSLISMIRKNRDYHVIVIGVDAGVKEDLVGWHFCDKFYTVPYAYAKNYIPSMLRLCRKEKVSVVFPGSDEEALVLSRNKGTFSSYNIKIASPEASTIEKSMDKMRLMALLKNNKIRVGKFCEFKKVGDIKRHAVELGYPKRNVVIKPRIARGSRGFRIITGNLNPYENFLGNQLYFTSLREIQRIFSLYPGRLKDFFMMEYLSGPHYSVDILMERSRPVTCVCRKKIFPIGSPTQIADIVYDEYIIEYASKIASFLEFDYFVQVEVGRDRYGRPCLVEINPRIDATLPIVEGVGINYFERMIYYAQHDVFPRRDFRPQKKALRFYRYWQHIFRKA